MGIPCLHKATGVFTMPLAMPQPDYEPVLRFPSASHARLEVDSNRFVGPDDEDEDDDPVGDDRRASHLLIVHEDRR
jgi:hypothetical protein